MNTENFFTGAIAAAFIAFTLSVSSCSVITNDRDDAAMEAMVAKGADPLAARCAVHPTDNNSCAILAAHR